MGTPAFHPSDEDLSLGTPAFHPSDEDLSLGTPVRSGREDTLCNKSMTRGTINDSGDSREFRSGLRLFDGMHLRRGSRLDSAFPALDVALSARLVRCHQN